MLLPADLLSRRDLRTTLSLFLRLLEDVATQDSRTADTPGARHLALHEYSLLQGDRVSLGLLWLVAENISEEAGANCR